MRAPLRGGSRAGLRHAEPVSAGATDALENALRAVHTYRSANALRVVGHKRAGGRAQRVVGGVVVVLGGGASEAAEATRGEGRDAARGLVDEQVHLGLAVLDGIDVVAIVNN